MRKQVHKLAKGPRGGRPKNAYSSVSTTRQDRIEAKQAGLKVIDYRILATLADSAVALDYKQIESCTGYYSILTARLRSTHADSLTSRGLTIESIVSIDGVDRFTFTVSAAGRRLVQKARAAVGS